MAMFSTFLTWQFWRLGRARSPSPSWSSMAVVVRRRGAHRAGHHPAGRRRRAQRARHRHRDHRHAARHSTRSWAGSGAPRAGVFPQDLRRRRTVDDRRRVHHLPGDRHPRRARGRGRRSSTCCSRTPSSAWPCGRSPATPSRAGSVGIRVGRILMFGWGLAAAVGRAGRRAVRLPARTLDTNICMPAAHLRLRRRHPRRLRQPARRRRRRPDRRAWSRCMAGGYIGWLGEDLELGCRLRCSSSSCCWSGPRACSAQAQVTRV